LSVESGDCKYTAYWKNHPAFLEMLALADARGLVYQMSSHEESESGARPFHYGMADGTPVPNPIDTKKVDRQALRQMGNEYSRFLVAKDEIYDRYGVTVNGVRENRATRDHEFMAYFVTIKQCKQFLLHFPDWKEMADLAIRLAEESGARYKVVTAPS